MNFHTSAIQFLYSNLGVFSTSSLAETATSPYLLQCWSTLKTFLLSEDKHLTIALISWVCLCCYHLLLLLLLFFTFSLKHFILTFIPCSIFCHCLISSFISGKCSLSPISHIIKISLFLLLPSPGGRHCFCSCLQVVGAQTSCHYDHNWEKSSQKKSFSCIKIRLLSDRLNVHMYSNLSQNL